MLKRITQLDRKFIISLVVAFILGAISIYAAFFYERRAHIQYHILSDSNVLDIHAELSKLDITYDGKSIKKTSQNLRIVTLRIINSGNASILQQHYASTDPLGIKVARGDIVEKPELLKASSQYLEKNIAFQVVNTKTILFPNVIFDPNDYIEIKLLLLHAKDVKPEILPLGKIANISPPQVIKSSKAGGEASETRKMVEKIVVFTFFGLLLLGLAVGMISDIYDVFRKRKRRKIVLAYRSLSSKQFNEKGEIVFDGYINHGREHLSKIREYLADGDRLAKLVPILAMSRRIDSRFFGEFLKRPRDKAGGRFAELAFIERLLEAGLIVVEDSSYHVDKELEASLVGFSRFVWEKEI